MGEVGFSLILGALLRSSSFMSDFSARTGQRRLLLGTAGGAGPLPSARMAVLAVGLCSWDLDGQALDLLESVPVLWTGS